MIRNVKFSMFLQENVVSNSSFSNLRFSMWPTFTFTFYIFLSHPLVVSMKENEFN